MLNLVPKERTGAQIGTGRALLGAPIFWAEVLLVYLVTFSLRFAERSARWLFFPNDDMVLAEREIEVRARARMPWTLGSACSPVQCLDRTGGPMYRFSKQQGVTPSARCVVSHVTVRAVPRPKPCLSCCSCTQLCHDLNLSGLVAHAHNLYMYIYILI